MSGPSLRRQAPPRGKPHIYWSRSRQRWIVRCKGVFANVSATRWKNMSTAFTAARIARETLFP